MEMGAITPGSPDDSEMLRRIGSDDPDEKMPPPETQKHVTAEQVDRLRLWIEQGATYEPHWSLLHADTVTVAGVVCRRPCLDT